jgi:hypothetical protein
VLHVAHYGLQAQRQRSAVATTFVLKDGKLEPVPTPRSSTPLELDVVLLLLAAVPGWLLVRALRTGTGYWRFGAIDRDETPLYFWIYVFVNGLLVVWILSAIF